VAIAKSIMVADMNEPLRMPYNNVVSSDLVESTDCAMTDLEFVYRGEGACCVPLLEVCISTTRSTFDIEHKVKTGIRIHDLTLNASNS